MSSNIDIGFTVSYDRATKLITAAICVFLIVLALATLPTMEGGCIAAGLIAMSYAFSPRGYVICEGSVLIRRLAGSVRIPLNRVREIRVASSGDLQGSIAILASKGFFGHYGLYRTSKLGLCHWYVTRFSNGVILLTDKKTVVFSPDDVHGFIGAFESSGITPALYSAPHVRSRGWIQFAIGVMAILILAVPLFLYSPGPAKYTIAPQELTIHDRFFPGTVKAAEVNIEGIRVVDVGKDPHWRLTQRSNGIGLLHYHAGWFRVAGGEKVRMYRADNKRLVLLPPQNGGTPVLLDVKQPKAFILELRQAWR
jgi:hypothetical protein